MTPARSLVAEHQWHDDALRPKGRAWVAGVAFTCAKCGMQRRVVGTWSGQGAKTDASHTNNTNVYYMNGKRLSRAGDCPKETT